MGDLVVRGDPARPVLFFTLVALGLGGATAGAALVLAGSPRPAGIAVMAAGAALAAAGVAAGRRTAPRIALIDGMADRLGEAMVLGALAWAAMPDRPRMAGAALLALGASYLARYLRVRGSGLGFELREPISFRAARPQLVGIGLALGVVEAGLWAVAALSGAVLAAQIADAARQRRTG